MDQPFSIIILPCLPLVYQFQRHERLELHPKWDDEIKR